MGKGKGDIDFWAAPSSPEPSCSSSGGVTEDKAKLAFKRVAHKMPIKVKMVRRLPTYPPDVREHNERSKRSRGKTDAELDFELAQMKKELFDLRFRTVDGHVGSTRRRSASSVARSRAPKRSCTSARKASAAGAQGMTERRHRRAGRPPAPRGCRVVSDRDGQDHHRFASSGPVQAPQVQEVHAANVRSYHAHDEKPRRPFGDTVEIECRPLSKTLKRWRLVERVT